MKKILIATLLFAGCLTETPDETPDTGNTGQNNDAGTDATDSDNCTPEPELCDGVDNDCDDEIDEDFATLGDACSVGQGLCAAEGIEVCSPDFRGTVCNVEEGAPDTEICNNLDDNCDGAVDEGCDDDEDGYCDSNIELNGMSDACPMGGGDCNDENDAVYPNAPGACDGIDNNCDGNDDELAAVSEITIDLPNIALDATSDFPILLDWAGDTMCIAAQQADSRIQYFFDDHRYSGSGVLYDVSANGTRCFGVTRRLVNPRFHLVLTRWDTEFVTNVVDADTSLNFRPSLTAGLAEVVSFHLNTMVDPGLSVLSKYPIDFSSTSAGEKEAGARFVVGDTALEMSPRAGTETIAINIGNQLAVGNQNDFAISTINDTSRLPFLGNIGDRQYLAAVVGGTLTVYEINPNQTLGSVGSVPGDVASSGQDFLPRHLFAPSPQEDIGLFVDPFAETLYQFEENQNGMLEFEAVTLPNPQDHLIGVRSDGDTVEVVQVSNIGVPGATDAQLRVVSLTCH